jgi:hypothetical protein
LLKGNKKLKKGDVLMSNAVYFVSFKLKKEASVPDFLHAAETLNNEYISKQKGYISWKQLVDGDTWADVITFETMNDLNSFKDASNNPSEIAIKFYSFIKPNTCKVHLFTVERSY